MRILPNASLLYFWVAINNENNYQCQRGCGLGLSLNYAKAPESYNFVSMSLGFGVCVGVKLD